MAKKTKDEMIKEVAKTYETELKRNYVKAISQGYKLALSDILKSSEAPDFNLKEFCEKELKLRGNMDVVLDKMYDKESDK